MHDFTKTKFLSLPLKRQHKKCAEIVRQLYEKLPFSNVKTELAAYHQLVEWMQDAPLPSMAPKMLADRYHWHLQQGEIYKKEHHLLPPIRQGDRPQGEVVWSIHVYLDHIRSAHNVGSILRTVEAFALGDVYFSADTPFVDHKQVKDASMGCHAWVDCHPQANLSKLAHPIIALETSEEAISLHEFIFPETFTLVVGNEEYGCSDTVLSQTHYLIEIPLRGRKNSLNVANAFAIVASEIARQKTLRVAYEQKT